MMPLATKSGADAKRPTPNPATKPATSPATPAPKRRGMFGWFFKSKHKPTPVTVDAPKKTSETAALGQPVVQKEISPPPAPPERRREKAIDRLEKGYAEVTELVHALRQHIDRQADRSERLLEKMDHLPEALESLPKVSHTNHELLGTMQKHLEQQQEHSERLTQVINGLVHASKHRDDAIDMLRQQFSAMQEKDARLMDGFSTLGENMSKICDFQQKSASVLDRVMQMGAQAEQRMRDMLDINKRNARTLAMSGWALVVVSIAMTAFVAVAATRLASMPAAAPSPQPVIESGQTQPAQGESQATATAAPEIDLVEPASLDATSELSLDSATPETQPLAVDEAELLAAIENIRLDVDWNALAGRAAAAGQWFKPFVTTGASALEQPQPQSDDAVVDRVAASGGSE